MGLLICCAMERKTNLCTKKCHEYFMNVDRVSPGPCSELQTNAQLLRSGEERIHQAGKPSLVVYHSEGTPEQSPYCMFYFSLPLLMGVSISRHILMLLLSDNSEQSREMLKPQWQADELASLCSTELQFSLTAYSWTSQSVLELG